MAGEPEIVAKAMILALFSLAMKEKRKCYLISFSTQIQTLDLSEIQQSLPQLIEFLSMSFHGGTDATDAFVEALRVVNTQEYKNADILMVSDFVMPSLPREVTQKIDEAKSKKTRLHALIIAQYPENYPTQKHFDNFWLYNRFEERSAYEKISKIERHFL